MKKSTYKIVLEVIKAIVSILLGYAAGSSDVVNTMF